jgi:Kdo2-lipid IVA lauroyltransferase/acyltransferase
MRQHLAKPEDFNAMTHSNASSPAEVRLFGWSYVVWLLMRVLGLIPLRSMQFAGRGFGRLLSTLPIRASRVARQNIALCFPALSARAQRALMREALAHTAQSVFELPWIWTRPYAEQTARMDVDATASARIAEMLAQGRGLILAAPHIGAWELLNRWLAAQTPMLVLYRAPKVQALEALLLRCRAVPGVSLLRAEPAAVRILLKRLQAGGALGILPDQQPKAGEGQFAPFFGIAAMTMTLLPKLAVRAECPVLFCYAERLAAGRFRIVVQPADPVVCDAESLNANVEQIARRLPAQYQLTYKRFSMRPEGEPKRYTL